MPDGETYIDREGSNSVEDTRPRPYSLIGLKRVKHFEAIPGAKKLPKVRNKKARKEKDSECPKEKPQISEDLPNTSQASGMKNNLVDLPGCTTKVSNPEFKKPQIQGSKKKIRSSRTRALEQQVKKVCLLLF